ncbi:hypothetical protein ACFL96_17150, partial [Thermoproteota archaeon]
MAQKELSLAEITTYLETNALRYRFEAISNKAVILNANINVDNVMNRLSGFYKIGIVKCVLDSKDITNEINLENKLNSVEFYSW